MVQDSFVAVAKRSGTGQFENLALPSHWHCVPLRDYCLVDVAQTFAHTHDTAASSIPAGAHLVSSALLGWFVSVQQEQMVVAAGATLSVSWFANVGVGLLTSCLDKRTCCVGS